MTQEENFAYLLFKIKKMRHYQNAYFRNGKMDGDLKQAKYWEKAVDDFTARMEREGIKPKDFAPKSEQQNIF